MIGARKAAITNRQNGSALASITVRRGHAERASKAEPSAGSAGRDAALDQSMAQFGTAMVAAIGADGRSCSKDQCQSARDEAEPRVSSRAGCLS
jgi:hypothetical protein